MSVLDLFFDPSAPRYAPALRMVAPDPKVLTPEQKNALVRKTIYFQTAHHSSNRRELEAILSGYGKYEDFRYLEALQHAVLENPNCSRAMVARYWEGGYRFNC